MLIVVLAVTTSALRVAVAVPRVPALPPAPQRQQLRTSVVVPAAPGMAPGRPCDIYAAGGTPCVAAHSIVRALYAGYAGPLFTVRRPRDNATLAITATAQGFADTAAQDIFCGFSRNQFCTLHRIFDQSPKGNHLDPVRLGSRRAPTPAVDSEVPLLPRSRRTVGGQPGITMATTGITMATTVHPATQPPSQTTQPTCPHPRPPTRSPICPPRRWDQLTRPPTVTPLYTIHHAVYAAVFEAGMGYRNVNTTGVATGDQPESMYAVLGGDRFNDKCCFDYGNAELRECP